MMEQSGPRSVLVVSGRSGFRSEEDGASGSVSRLGSVGSLFTGYIECSLSLPSGQRVVALESDAFGSLNETLLLHLVVLTP